MKHYFVDTNVVIDMLADREGYADAACELFDAAGRGEVHLSICALSYSTIYYILRKYAGKENAISSLRDLTEQAGKRTAGKTPQTGRRKTAAGSPGRTKKKRSRGKSKA